MIVFRQTDARYPFLWESANQPAGRWHSDGEGPAHYFADTPAGAWAEFLRHEEITDPDDLHTIRRQIWAVDVGDEPATPVQLRIADLTGGPETYARCQQEAHRLRKRGARRLVAPSAALVPGGAQGTIVRNGPRPAPSRDGNVIVLFEAPHTLVGWVVADVAQPSAEMLGHVRHYPPR